MKAAVLWITAIAALAATQCRKQPPPVPSAPDAREMAARKVMARELALEDANLLGFNQGAVVMNRTGELNLEASAVQAIDGSHETVWATPPSDPQQSLSIALAAKSRITSVGYTTVPVSGSSSPPRIQFDTSTDALAWKPLKTIASTGTKLAEMMTVEPVDARYVRVSFPESGTSTLSVASLLATGNEVEPYRRPDITGSWTVNGLRGLFLESGSRVHGTVEMNPTMTIEGGWSGRTIPFVWTRGPQFGFGVLALSSDGKYLNGEWWYEEAIPLFYGTTWFGEKQNTYPDTGNEFDVLNSWLQHSGRAPLYGIAFSPDGTIDVKDSESVLRWLVDTIKEKHGQSLFLVSRDWSHPADADNIAVSRRRLVSLRQELTRRGAALAGVSFEPLGSTKYKEHPAWNLYRPVFARIELHIARSVKE